MFTLFFLGLCLVQLSFLIDPHDSEIRNVLNPLIEEFDFKNVLIVESCRKNQVSLMKNLHKLNIFTSTQDWDKIDVNSSRSTKQDTITILRNESPKVSFEKVLYFKKALVFLQDMAFENISTSIELELDQEIYFYNQKTCQLLETYIINNNRVTNILGALNISKESSFIWEDGTTKG